MCIVPGGRLGCVFGAPQPTRLVKSCELSVRTVPVAVSVTTTNSDSKASPPVFWNARFAHQPVPGQVSNELKETVKPGSWVAVGDGVDVREGVTVGVKEVVAVAEDVGVGVLVDVIVGEEVNVGEAVGMEDVSVEVG